MEPKTDKGVQDQQDAELNTPDGEFEGEIVPDESGIVHSAKDRDSIVGRYMEHQRTELKNEGFSEEEINLILKGEDDEGDEKEKPKEPEKEEADDEDAEDVDKEKSPKLEEEKKPEPEVKDEPGPDEDAGKPEPAKRELTEADILPFKVKVKVDGQETEVPVSELQKSYQIQGHLTRKLQEAAQYRGQLEQIEMQLKRQKDEFEQEKIDFENRIFEPEEIEQRKRERARKAEESKAAFQNTFMQCRNVLYQRHPDADQLDYDPDFADFRQKNAPYINEQLLNSYGPGVFFPAMDLLFSYYKDVKKTMDALQQAHDATTSFKKEREAELKQRESEQREQKKKAKDIKPSTTKGANAQGDEDEPGDPRDYVRTMNKKRLAAQQLRD